MSDFKVDYAALSESSDNFSNIQQRFSQYSDEIRSVANNLSFRVSAVTALGIRLRLMSNNANTIAWKSGNVSKATQKISEQYRSTENTIANANDQDVKNKTGLNGKKSSSSDDSDGWLISMLKEIGWIGGIVTFGSGISDIINSSSVKEIADNVIKTSAKAIKKIVDVEKYAKGMGKAKRMLKPGVVKAGWIKKIFGGNGYIKVSKAKSFGKRISSNLKKATSKKVSSIGWLDVAVSGITNAIDNKNEYESGENSSGRAVAETVSETAIDVGTDMALTIDAAAVIGAVFGGAPVIAVGAAVGLAKWGLDSVAKWATGGEKDFTEAVSDAVLDVGGAAIEEVSNRVKKIGKGISSAFKSIGAKWCLAT